MKEEIQKSKDKFYVVEDPSGNRIKIKWKVDKDDSNNGGYDEVTLRKFLKKYGNITVVVMSPTKKGSALVQFATKEAAEMAVELEKGIIHIN